MESSAAFRGGKLSRDACGLREEVCRRAGHRPDPRCPPAQRQSVGYRGKPWGRSVTPVSRGRAPLALQEAIEGPVASEWPHHGKVQELWLDEGTGHSLHLLGGDGINLFPHLV